LLRLLGASDVTVEFPPVSEEPLHRMVQAIDQAGRTGVPFDTERRALLLKALALEGGAEAPDADEIPKIVHIRAGQNEQQEYLAAPAQPERPSYGDHELRDEGGQAHTEKTSRWKKLLAVVYVTILVFVYYNAREGGGA